MKKSILTVTIMTMASAGYAFELHNAVVLEHQSWISGADNKGVVITGHLENSLNNPSLSASTGAHTSSENGTVNRNIYTQGSHNYSVNNTSEIYQTYTVELKLCANGTYCFHDQTRMGVEKDGYFSNYATSYLTCMFSYAGNYDLEATTAISGDTSSSAHDRATIYVTN